MKTNFILSILIIPAMLLCACTHNTRLQKVKDEVAAMKRAANDSKNQKPISIAFDLPKPVTYQQNVLQATASNTTTAAEKPAMKKSANNGLLNHSLKSLQFVGVMTQDNTNIAYIIAPDNVMYQVKEGDLIGNNYGKISKITPDHIEILERNLQSGKPVQEEKVILQLKD